MADILEIETTVLVDGAEIDFAGAAGAIDASQLAAVVLATSPAPPIQASQLASVVLTTAVSNIRASQMAVVVLASGPPAPLTLRKVIPLGCWQPCTAYGTNAIIAYLNGSF